MTDDVCISIWPTITAAHISYYLIMVTLWSTLKKEFDDCCAQSSVTKRRRVSMEEREALMRLVAGRLSRVCESDHGTRIGSVARRTELVLSHEPWHEHDSCCKYVIT